MHRAEDSMQNLHSKKRMEGDTWWGKALPRLSCWVEEDEEEDGVDIKTVVREMGDAVLNRE